MANKLREIFVKDSGDMKVTCEGNVFVEGEDGKEIVVPMNPPVEEGFGGSMMVEPAMLSAMLATKSTCCEPSPTPSTQKTLFSVKPNGDVEWRTEPLNEVTLVAEESIDHALVIGRDQNDLDKYVKTQLAEQLAKKMIEEDLIEIYSDFDIELNVHKFKAKVKIVQE